MISFLDVSGRVVLKLVGSESLDFMQRISTNDVASLKVGQSRQTVLTNEKGRIIDVVSIQRTTDSQLMLLSQSRDASQLVSWIEKYIIMEDIRIEEVTSSLTQYLIYGFDVDDEGRFTSFLPREATLLSEEFGIPRLVQVVGPRELGELIEQALASAGAVRQTFEEFEEYRILIGIPGYGTELTLQYNPLEANLGKLISWTKGCYIGQEVIARLETYKKVQRNLVSLGMSEVPGLLPIPFQDEDGEAGVITSATKIASTGEIRGLGYLKVTGSDRPKTHHFFNDGRKVFVQIHPIA
jgi:folate-binding protein YgfZ